MSDAVNGSGAAGMRSCRFLVAAFGDPGHAFPAIGLARALAGRGHEVVVETWERWREPVEELGLEFTAAEDALPRRSGTRRCRREPPRAG